MTCAQLSQGVIICDVPELGQCGTNAASISLILAHSWQFTGMAPLHMGLSMTNLIFCLFGLSYFFFPLLTQWGHPSSIGLLTLTHWGRVTHVYVSKLTIIGSDNGLSPGRRQAIIWTSAGILLIGPLGTNFSEILSKIHTFSFRKMNLKTMSAKWRPFCLGLNVLTEPFMIKLTALTQRVLT